MIWTGARRDNKHERRTDRSGEEENAIHMTTAGSSLHYARPTSKVLVFHVGRSLYIGRTERESYVLRGIELQYEKCYGSATPCLKADDEPLASLVSPT